MRYHDLLRELAGLRRQFIPSDAKWLTAITAQQERNAVSFRVLSHAAIEHYVENCVLDLGYAAYEKWQKGSNPSNVLLAIACYCGQPLGIPSEAFHEVKNKADWEANHLFASRVSKAFDTYLKVIDDNNGLKPQSLLKLLAPVGANLKALDPLWLADMERFGSARGLAAHRAPSRAARVTVDPQTELSRIMGILPGLLALDLELRALENTL